MDSSLTCLNKLPINGSKMKQEFSNESLLPVQCLDSNKIKQEATIPTIINFVEVKSECDTFNAHSSNIDVKTHPIISTEFDIKEENSTVMIPSPIGNENELQFEIISENLHKCKMCSFVTMKKSNYLQHMRYHMRKKPFECELCGLKTAHKANLAQHMKIHIGEKPFECSKCYYKTAQKSKLTRHMTIHTGERPFRCTVCGFETARRLNLEQHMLVHTGEKPYGCDTCGFKTAHKAYLLKHMKSHDGKKTLWCRICGLEVPLKFDLVEHMKSHTSKKPYRCGISGCEYKSGDKSDLTKQIIFHNTEEEISSNRNNILCDYSIEKTKFDTFSCTIDKVENQAQTTTICKPSLKIVETNYDTSQSLLDNQLILQDEALGVIITSRKVRFHCPHCKYKTAYKGNFDRHTRTHTGEKPFKCDLCQYRTCSKSDVVRHMKSHTGEKPFECHTCGYKTIRKYDLINHMRIHSGEKPFQCRLCEFKTFLKASLAGHEKVHTGNRPYACTVCGLRVSHKSNLVQHMKIHTGEKPFRCEVNGCVHRTVRRSDLLKHMKKHHGIEEKMREEKLENGNWAVFYIKEEPHSLQ